MNNTVNKYILAAGLFFTLFLLGCSGENHDAPQNSKAVKQSDEFYEFHKEGELTFRTSENEYISSVEVEMAETESEISRGMKSRMELTENQGMFFVFPDNEVRSFWMQNTFVPLDVIFVNSDNVIVHINKNARPLDETSFSSYKPAMYVVEVKGGYADKYGIEVGGRIVWRRI